MFVATDSPFVVVAVVVAVLWRVVAVATDRSVSREAPTANTVVALRFLRVVGGLMMLWGRGSSFPDAAVTKREFVVTAAVAVAVVSVVSVGPGSSGTTGAESDCGGSSF